MKILIDADACPNVIKEILYRAAERLQLSLILVANQSLKIPASSYISAIEVDSGFDIADDRIVDLVERNDLVISADIPLANRVIEKGGYVIDPRGDLYSAENIKERLAVRDLMEDLRSGGIETGGPPAFTQKDRQAFANQLDRFLVNHMNK